MQIIIPMAGICERFKNKGYDQVKYLLNIGNKTIIESIIHNFDVKNDSFLFICNELDFNNKDIHTILKSLNIRYNIISIESHKLGPVYTVDQAKEYINDSLPAIVNYCDFSWLWDYQDFKKQVQGYDGAVMCYKGFHPHLLGPDLYAGVKVNNKNELLKITEKHSFTEDKMDTFQSSGSYYFKNGSLLKKYHAQIISQDITCNGEFYTSNIFQLMKEDNLKSLVFEIPKFLQLGTPGDYEEFKYWEEIFTKKKI